MRSPHLIWLRCGVRMGVCILEQLSSGKKGAWWAVWLVKCLLLEKKKDDSNNPGDKRPGLQRENKEKRNDN